MSLTFAASLAALLAQLLLLAGIEVQVTSLETTINTLVTIGAAALALYGRYRLGDITPVGTRKDNVL
jgi:hypothetical protein